MRSRLLIDSLNRKLEINIASNKVKIINKMIEKKYWEGRS